MVSIKVASGLEGLTLQISRYISGFYKKRNLSQHAHSESGISGTNNSHLCHQGALGGIYSLMLILRIV